MWFGCLVTPSHVRVSLCGGSSWSDDPPAQLTKPVETHFYGDRSGWVPSPLRPPLGPPQAATHSSYGGTDGPVRCQITVNSLSLRSFVDPFGHKWTLMTHVEVGIW